MVDTSLVKGEDRVDLAFTVLGGTVSASEGGRPLPLGGAQQRRVLAAFLAEAGVVVSADRLVEAIWPDGMAPEGARRTAMSYVSRLRATIGPDHLVTRDNGYVLELDGAAYDAAQFEAGLAEARRLGGEDAVASYDAALALWTGRAFGVDGDESWLRPVAARLDELRLLASEERAEQLIDCSRHAEAVAELERLVAEQPLRERFVDLLMRALYLAGRQAEALRAFRRYHDYLAEETGLPPSDGLIDLERRITVGDPSLAPAAGEAVPGYELAEVIGEGAFGAVYRAVQPSVGREVAVKVVQPDLADDPRFVQRFEAEAQLVARIEHPHVVPLYDYWRRPGGAFLVFRLLRGGSLADREADGPLGLGDVTRLVEEIGGALAAAHALGVVHRDVKPANILFDETGNSYLADFGIAKLDGTDDALDLRSAGSPLYASPEQIRDATASPASDQYALAVVAWEALCGRAPFAGSTVSEIGRVKFVDAVPPLDAGAGADAIGPVLAKATAPHPSDRFGSVAELVMAWRLATAGPDLVHTTGDSTGAPAGRTVAETVASLAMTGVNPYKGLRAFQEADAGEFCGREELVLRLFDQVADEPFVTVVGPSGSGKSSLVHAGVVPRFRRGGGLVISMVPGTEPLVELEAALRRVATAEAESTIGPRLRTPGGLVEVARGLVAPGEQLLLVVDQFEELWTLVPDSGRRDHFADLLAHAAQAQDGLRVVATLRADQFDRPLQHAALGPVVSATTFAVTPMSASELQDAIVVPAERAGVRFEPGLVSTIVGDVVSRPGALPLLQFALTELFERRQNATVTTEAYDELGGIGGALARRAEDVYEATAVEQRDDVHRLFTRLVTPGDDGDDLRRRAIVAEVADVAPTVIEAYRANRLIVTDHHPVTREPTVEVAHEALLREWPRLAAWIDHDRDAIRVHRGLAQAAHEWQADPADESTLYRGTRLVAADEVARSLTLSSGEHDFVAASHQLADRERQEAEERARVQTRQNRRLRGMLAAAAILLLVALLTGAFAVEQRRRSDRDAAAATQSRILADAERLAPVDRDVSLLLAAEAARRGPSVATTNALATALLTEDAFLRYEGDPNGERVTVASDIVPADGPAFSPDSTQLAVPDSAAGEVRIVDVATGEVERVLDFPALKGNSAVRSVRWLPSDILLLVAVDEVVGIDATSGVVRIPDAPLPGSVSSWAVNEDGSRAALVSLTPDDQFRVTVLALPSGEVLVERPPPCCNPTLAIGPARVERALGAAVAWRDDELYVGSGSGRIDQWDPDSGRRVRTLGDDFPAAVATDALRFVDGGASLVISGAMADGTPELMAYDPDTGRAQWDEPQHFAGNLVEDPRHHAVIVADSFGSGILGRFDIATGEPAATFDTQTGTACIVRTSPDGQYLAAASCAGSAVALWSLAGAGAAIRHVTEDDHVLGAPIFNRDGSYAVLSDDDGVHELEMATGEVTPISVPPGFRPYMAYHQHTFQVQLFSVSGELAQSTEELARPTEPFTLTRSNFILRDQSVSIDLFDHELVAMLYVDGVTDVTTLEPAGSDPRPPLQIPYEPGTAADNAFSPDGDRLYITGTEGFRVYDLTDGHLIDEPFPGFKLAMDRRRRVLAVGQLDGTLTLRDAATLERLGPDIAAPPGAELVFTPDGRTLIVAAAGGSLRLYDVASSASIGPAIDLGPGSFNPLPDSRSVLLERDGAIVELGLEPATWLEQACRAAGRNLTSEEWATYIGGTPRATCPQWPAPSD